MVRQSRFQPCPLWAGDDWCGGIAVLMGRWYVCQRCSAAWDRDGDPVTGDVA